MKTVDQLLSAWGMKRENWECDPGFVSDLIMELDSRDDVPRQEWKPGDPDRRKDNWTLITAKYEPMIGQMFKRHGEEYYFFGLVHADDDYYYGLVKKGTGERSLILSSCVGSLEDAFDQPSNSPRQD